MKRPVRDFETGLYTVNGKDYKELFGSRTQVHNGTAYKTTGGLTKSDLMMNKWGRIVSEKKHKTAKKEKRLQKHGFFAKKGKFGYVKRSMKKRSGKMRGGESDMNPATTSEVVGAPESSILSPASAN
jgi:hypothetical protein